MKKQYILPAVLFFLGVALYAYSYKKDRTQLAEGVTSIDKTNAAIGILGGILGIVGASLFLYRWQ